MEQNKDFKKWADIKININQREEKVFFKEREIWWCSLGCNIGSEQDGKNDNFERPVLIFRIFGDNVLWVMPISTKLDELNSRLSYRFSLDGIMNNTQISQLRLISSKRMIRYIGMISYEDFQNIRNYYKDLY